MNTIIERLLADVKAEFPTYNIEYVSGFNGQELLHGIGPMIGIELYAIPFTTNLLKTVEREEKLMEELGEEVEYTNYQMLLDHIIKDATAMLKYNGLPL